MSEYHHLYCDESFVDGGGSFYFGGLYCSPRRAEILRSGLKEVRAHYDCRREMKWTKVSRKMLPAYTAFVDIFLDDPFARFIVMEVVRGESWKSWASNEEKRFFKAYYVFLRMNMRAFIRYGIYLDYKPSKWYRWSGLYYAINNAGFRDYDLSKKQICELKAVNSKAEDLVQLVDVLLGASVSNATVPPKAQLAQYVRQRFGDITRSGKDKIKMYAWTPARTG